MDKNIKQDKAKVELLPNNPEAELAILAALLTDTETGEALNTARAELRPEYFDSLENRQVFNAIIQSSENKNIVNFLDVGDYLRKANGNKYDYKLAEIDNAFKDKLNVDGLINLFQENVKKLFDTYQKRETYKLLDAAKGRGPDALDEIAEFIIDGKAKLDRIGKTPPTMAQYIHDGLYTKLTSKTNDSYISTFSSGLNTIFNGGLQRGRFTILTAPAGGGKTTLVLNLLDNIAHNEIKCVYFSLEMSLTEILARSLARLGRIDGGGIEQREYIHNDDLLEKLNDTLETYHKTIAPYITVIEADRGLTINQVKAEVKKIQKYDINAPVVIAIDPLHGLSTGDKYLDVTPIEKYGIIGGDLKRLARDLNVPVIGISDTTKEAQKRADKGEDPGADLRYSYELNHRADTIANIRTFDNDNINDALNDKKILLHNLDTVKKNNIIRQVDKKCNLAILQVTKNRSGRTGKVYFFYHKNLHRFDEIDFLRDKEPF